MHLDHWYSESVLKTSLSEDLAMVEAIVVSNIEYVLKNDIVEMKKLLGEAEACTGCNYLFIITTMLKILRSNIAIILIVEVIDVITSI